MAQARRPSRLIARRPPSPWARLRWPVVLLGIAIVYGVLAYMLVEGWSFLDSLYMTMLTLSTVGLEEVRSLDSSGEVITIGLMVMGASIVLVTVSLASIAISEGGLGEPGRRRRMEKRISSLKDHFIICAYGRVGRTIAREFAAEGAPFVVIDKDDALEEVMLQDGVLYIIGDPTSEPTLTAAGLERARGLICAVDSDADNVFITLAARSLNPEISIVARAAEETSAERLYHAGANRVISPYVTSGKQMAVAALRPRVLDYFYIGNGDPSGLKLEEIEIGADSPLVGKTLEDAERVALVLAVRRADGEIIARPSPGHRFESGDLLFLIGENEALRPVEE